VDDFAIKRGQPCGDWARRLSGCCVALRGAPGRRRRCRTPRCERGRPASRSGALRLQEKAHPRRGCDRGPPTAADGGGRPAGPPSFRASWGRPPVTATASAGVQPAGS